MTKTFSLFVAGLCTGVAATLALCPSVREEAHDAITDAKTEAKNRVSTHRQAIANSVEAAKATYRSTVKSAGFETAPMES
jgi:hypothetical protein